MSETTIRKMPPRRCDTCGEEPMPGPTFVDGRIGSGSWANMCEPCHVSHGRGMGLGVGQRYETATGDKAEDQENRKGVRA